MYQSQSALPKRSPQKLDLFAFEGYEGEILLAAEHGPTIDKTLYLRVTLTRVGPQVKFYVHNNDELVFEHVYLSEAIEFYNTL